MTPQHRSALVVASLLALGAPFLTGCGDDGPVAEATPAVPSPMPEDDGEDRVPPLVDEPADERAVEPTGVVVPVIALDNSFRPERIEIAVGDAVEWENRGMNEHNVLYVEGDDWGVEVNGFQPGAVYSHVFAEPGEYHYYCSIHGSTEVGMVGTVVVTG